MHYGDTILTNIQEDITRLEEHTQLVMSDNPPPLSFDARDRAALANVLTTIKQQQSQSNIELDGFLRQTVVALSANMAAATIHSGKMLEWDKLVPNAMTGAKECWKAILEERNARSKID
jgi:hypothetical protein